MKILLVSHPPLLAEFGAGQVVLNLGQALRDLGHDADGWSPEPLPAGTRWWNLWKYQRRAIERYAASRGPFDAIDVPAISASRELARHGALVVRSVQPELLYLRHAVAGDLAYRVTPRSLLHAVLAGPRAAAILDGWRRARLILSQGTWEREWMRRRFPFWAAKLGMFVCATSPDEREALAAVRRQRQARLEKDGVRFLWIGRWTGHKGTGRLIDFFSARAAAFPADTLTIAGCGPTAERDIPEALLRSGRVRLVPSFQRTELPSLLARHDAGLFTSSLEGWGLNLNEMLESGLPVYATEAGGVIDLRPYFPGQLLPFPPAGRPAVPLPDLAANGYFERCSWPAIARSWEAQVGAALERRR